MIFSENRVLISSNHTPGERYTYPTGLVGSVAVGCSNSQPNPSGTYGGVPSWPIDDETPKENLKDGNIEKKGNTREEQGEFA